MHRADRQFVLTSIYVICTLIVTFAAMFAQANDYYVSMDDGNNGNTGTSPGDAWRTISWAMDHVPTNGTYANPHIIHVAPGTYTYTTGGSNNETFPIHWRRGQSTPLHYVHLVGDDVDTTIISYGDWPPEGGYEEGILEAWISGIYLNGVTIATLTIRNGVAESADGGEIYIKNAQAHITGCVIEDGWGRLRGGGIYAEDAELFVTDCTLQRNKSNFGGGIACVDSTVEIRDCLVQDNETFYLDAGPHGGGIYMSGCGADCLIRDCDILGNKADREAGNGDGGGIYLIDSSPHIAHNMIRATAANYGGPGNTARSGAGIYMTGNSDPLIDEWNEIAENWAASNGGGIYANGATCEPRIEGNEFFWNESRGTATENGGGAIFGYKSRFFVQNNWIGSNTAYKKGGGIYCWEVSSEGSGHSVFDINWIHHNKAGTDGGGVYFKNGYSNVGGTGSKFSNNNVWANTADRGGGLCLYNSNSFTVQDNGIWDNSAASAGDGVLADSGSLTLFNNLIFSSTANDDQQTGVEVLAANVTIKNLTIAHHSDYGINAVSGNVWIWDSIIWGNATSITGSATVEVFYTDIQGGWGGTGSNNIDQNPLFVRLSGALGWPVGYFLSQTAAGQGSDSPCVDTGSAGASSIFTGSDYCTRTDAASDTDQVDMGYHYLHEGATYIELDSFEAKGLNEKVLVTWTTGTEIDNAGFDIYRKEDGTSNLVKVNGSLIPAQGTLGGGASYSFMDTNVVAGTKYLYYLVDIDANGRTTAHGPVSAAPYSVRVPSLHGGDGGARENAAPNMTKLIVK